MSKRVSWGGFFSECCLEHVLWCKKKSYLCETQQYLPFGNMGLFHSLYSRINNLFFDAALYSIFQVQSCHAEMLFLRFCSVKCWPSASEPFLTTSHCQRIDAKAVEQVWPFCNILKSGCRTEKWIWPTGVSYFISAINVYC